MSVSCALVYFCGHEFQRGIMHLAFLRFRRFVGQAIDERHALGRRLAVLELARPPQAVGELSQANRERSMGLGRGEAGDLLRHGV